MHRRFQDGMAIIRHFHKPDLFITMTCNPKCAEITEALLEGQKAQDRPDIVARVFKLKLKAIIQEHHLWELCCTPLCCGISKTASLMLIFLPSSIKIPVYARPKT
jgi:hypothetical protein